MGTNYYTVSNHCHHCKQYKREEHIGKASYGWAFSFQGYSWLNLYTWKHWKEYLKDKTIMDEYGDVISYEDFIEIVEVHKRPSDKLKQHNVEGKKSMYFDPAYDWDDADGYAFTSREFS